MQLKKAVVAVAAVGGALALVAEPSLAASVLSTEMKTSLTTGFSDLKDTVADVIATAWPVVIAITALIIAPGLVKKMMKSGAK